jgi:AcrR family transcriptional regulator
MAGRTQGKRGRLSRDVVVSTAVDIADAGGLESVSLAAVAAELGCAAPSLYNHVEGLDDLLDAVQIQCTWQLANDLRDAAVGRSGRDAVVAVAAAWRAFAARFPARYAAVFRVISGPDPDHIAAVDVAVRTSHIVQDSMGIGEDALAGASWVVRAYLQGFVQIEGREVIPDADAAFALGLDAVLDGLQAAAENASSATS